MLGVFVAFLLAVLLVILLAAIGVAVLLKGHIDASDQNNVDI